MCILTSLHNGVGTAQYPEIIRLHRTRLHVLGAAVCALEWTNTHTNRLEYAREFFIDPAEEEAEAAELAKRMEMEKAARLLEGDGGDEKSEGSDEAGSDAGGGEEQKQAVALLPETATGQDAELMRELQKRAMDEGEPSPQKPQSPTVSSRRLSEITDDDDEAGRQNRMGRRRSTIAVENDPNMIRISKGTPSEFRIPFAPSTNTRAHFLISFGLIT